MSEIRRYRVGMSLEALAGAWARTEDAQAGSCVVLEREVSGRLRGGAPWVYNGGLMMAVIQRPRIPPLQEALLWLAVTLGAARAISSFLGSSTAVDWPSGVVLLADEGGTDRVVCSTNVVAQLGPARVEHAILAVRVSLEVSDFDRESLLASLRHELASTSHLLDTDPLALIDGFAAVNPMMDQVVSVSLLPRGNARGKVVAIDPEGMLVLESATGMLERIAPASLRTLELAKPA